MMRLLSLAVVLSGLLLPVSAQSGSGWQLYSFCYFTMNTLATSPYLPWSMNAQGTMNVSTTLSTGFGYNNGSASGMGYQVLGITGTREVYVQGKAIQTNNILGVTAPGTYGANDNIVQTTSPYLLRPHALSFYLDGIAQFAAGPAIYPGQLAGSPNVTINAFAEYDGQYSGDVYIAGNFAETDNPPNDGVINSIQSGFKLAPTTGGFINSYAGCSLTRPAAPSIPQATLTAYNTPMTWPFCYQFVSGASDVAANGYSTTVSGVLTTTGYQGSSASGTLNGYLATAVSGTRIFTQVSNFPGVPNINFVMGIVAIGSPLSPYFQYPTYVYGTYEGSTNSTAGHYTYANNVLYPSFPYMDLFGISFVTNTTITDEDSYTFTTPLGYGNESSSVFVVYTDNTYTIYDTVFELYPGDFIYPGQNWADTLVVVSQTNYAATGLSMAAWTTATCGNDYSVTPTKYSFCYYIDDSSPSIPASQRGVVSVYGTFTAKTGLTRYGQPAMQLQGMSGIRTVFNSLTNTATTQSLIQLESPNGLFETFVFSQGYFWLTDNVLFTQPPWFSESGIAMVFADISNVTFPANQVTTSPYLNLYSEWAVGNPAGGFVEYAIGDLNFPNTAYYSGLTVSNFSYIPYADGQVATCAAQDNRVSMNVAASSFCLFHQSVNGWVMQFSGTLWTYSSAIYSNGRPGYIVQNIEGLRTYFDKSGVMDSDVIAGLSGDSLATSVGGVEASWGNAYDNLVFGSFPFFDTEGLLYTVNGPLGDLFGNGGVAVDNIGRLWSDGTNYYDESLYNISESVSAGTITDTWSYVLLTTYANAVQIIPDGGALANAGTVLSKCGQPAFQLFNFCYKLQQTLTTSPYLPWTVYVSGTLNVSMTSGGYWVGGPGYQVYGATGTRTLQYGGKTITNNIIGVAPQVAWNWNDNMVNLAAPFLSTAGGQLHVITFVLDGPAYFAGGPIPGTSGPNSTYVSIANFTGSLQEVDQPINDGYINSITSSFDMRFAWSGAAYVCPFANSTQTWDSTALSLYNTKQQISMCYGLSAGPGGYANLQGGVYQILVSVVLTTTSWGTSAANGSAVPAYLIQSATGTRTYIAPDGTNSTVNIILGGINANYDEWAQNGGGFDPSQESSNSFASSNIYYPQFPQLDSYGIQFIGSGILAEDGSEWSGSIGASTGNVDRVLWSGVDWEEWGAITSNGYFDVNYGGIAYFAPYNAAMAGSAFAAQCYAAYGATTVFSFCYYIDGGVASAGGYTAYAYGLITAAGPQSQYGRTAYYVQGMTGVHTLVLNNGTTWNQNIVNAEYMNEDTFSQYGYDYVWETDNLFFPSSVPEVSLLGIAFSLSSPVIFPSGAQQGTDIIISTDGLSSGNNLYEVEASSRAFGITTSNSISSTSYKFSSSPYTPGGSMVSCSNSALQVAAPPTFTTYSFCYAFSGPQSYNFVVSVAGSITVYSTPIPMNGRTGYAIANITGTRAYSDGMGRSFQTAITGISNDWVASQQGWSFDQLYYTTTPYVDSTGLLYSYSGFVNPNNPPQGVNYDRVIRLFANSSNPVVEEYYNTNGTQYFPTFTLGNGRFMTGAAGAVTAATCTANLPSGGNTSVYIAPSSTGAAASGAGSVSAGSVSSSSGAAVGGGALSSSSSGAAGGGGSSSSSGLSGGQIAGIVIGTVIGALLFCLLCFVLGVMRAGKKTDTDKPATVNGSRRGYSEQADTSRLGTNESVVEMQTAEPSQTGGVV